MHRFLTAFVLSIGLLAAPPSHAQDVASGAVTLPAGGRRGGTARPAAQSAEAIDYDTIHLEKRLSAVRARGAITLDGTLDEPAWSAASVAKGFIQNDPREGTPATYDTEVRVLYTDDALYFGVWAKDDEPSKIIVTDLKKAVKVGVDGLLLFLPPPMLEQFRVKTIFIDLLMSLAMQRNLVRC